MCSQEDLNTKHGKEFEETLYTFGQVICIYMLYRYWPRCNVYIPMTSSLARVAVFSVSIHLLKKYSVSAAKWYSCFFSFIIKTNWCLNTRYHKNVLKLPKIRTCSLEWYQDRQLWLSTQEGEDVREEQILDVVYRNE